MALRELAACRSVPPHRQMDGSSTKPPPQPTTRSKIPTLLKKSTSFNRLGRVVALDATVFRVVWIIVFCVRAATCVSLAGVVWYFLWANNHSANQELWQCGVHTMKHAITDRVIRLALFLCALVHVYNLLEMMQASWTYSVLTFHMNETNVNVSLRTNDTCQVQFRKPRMQEMVEWLARVAHRIWRFVVNVISNTFGFLGIRSKWYEEVYAIRESIELAVQSYQVYRMQCLIAHDLVNSIAIVALLLSGLLTGAVELWTKELEHKSIKTRLVLLLADSCLDFVFAIAIPLIIVMHFMSWVNLVTMTFDVERTRDDVWFATAIRDFQQITLSSGWDVVSSFVFQLGLLYSLAKVQQLVFYQGGDEQQDERLAVGGTTRINGAHRQPYKTKADNQPIHLVSEAPSRSHKRKRSLKQRVLGIVPMIHAMVGVTITVASIRARFGTNLAPDGCRLSGYDWFVRRQVCITMEINCYQLGLQGTSDEVETILADMDKKWLFTLIFAHCPALQMPTAIQRSKRLYMIEIYNSTVVEWTSDAALTQSTSPQLTYLRFYYTTFPNGTLPGGLVAHPLPSTVCEIAFINTNLAALPDPIESNWPSVLSLYLDYSRFREFPIVLGRAKSLRYLSMVHNALHEIPPGVLDRLNLRRLFLDGNPLERLPATIGDLAFEDACSAFGIENTWVSSLPLWLVDLLVRTKDQNAKGTTPAPFCQISLYNSSICWNRFTRNWIKQHPTAIKHSADYIDVVESMEWLMSKCRTNAELTKGWSGLQVTAKQRKLSSNT